MKQKVSCEIWQQRVRAGRASGLSAPRFAQREGLQVRSLYHWSWQLGANIGIEQAMEETKPSPEIPRPSFVEVPSVGLIPNQNTFIEINLPSGIQLKVPQNFDPAAIQTLMSALGRAS